MAAKREQQAPEEALLREAIEHEQAIADRARGVWDDSEELSPLLLERLYPLLAEPIPEAFIVRSPAGAGKPYESTGIKSVQVQIDRMNNVLGPAWWHDKASWNDDGTVCWVKVYIGRIGDEHPPLAIRHAVGGVDRGNTRGNLYKGSYTNAAKPAFARLGPGHEIYIGAADFDPDVNPQAAEEQAKRQAQSGEPEGEMTRGLAKELVDRAWTLGFKDKFRLAASTAAGEDVGDCASKAKAINAIKGREMIVGQRIDEWLQRKADEQAAQQT